MHKSINSRKTNSEILILSTLCFGLILGLMITNTIQKESTSENNYFDFKIITNSKINLEHSRNLNYTVNVNYANIPLQINYYGLLETDKGFEKINEQKQFVSGNFTTQYDVKLNDGKNKWSFVIEPIASSIDSIIHHGEFDEFQYPSKRD